MIPEDEAVKRLTGLLSTLAAFAAPIKDLGDDANGGTRAITEVRMHLGPMVRNVGVTRDRVALTDRGDVMGLVVHPEDWANLSDGLVLAMEGIKEVLGIAGPSVSFEEMKEVLAKVDQENGASAA